jgi:hypothetical protein
MLLSSNSYPQQEKKPWKLFSNHSQRISNRRYVKRLRDNLVPFLSHGSPAEDIEDKEERANTAEENSASLKKQISSIEKQIEELRNLIETRSEAVPDLGSETNSLSLNSIKQRIIELTDENAKLTLDINNDTTFVADQFAVKRGYQNTIEVLEGEIANASSFADTLDVEEYISSRRSRIEGLKVSINTVDSLIEGYRKTIENNTQLRDANQAILDSLNSYIDKDGRYSESYIELVKADLKRLERELSKLTKKQSKEDKIVEDLAEYQAFSSLSEEEQAEMVEKQKEKTFLVKTTPEDKIKQGTLGKALGNVQKALTQAYIDEIMKTATIGDLQRAIENIPGSDLLGTIISQFKCPNGATVYPPIDSFLSTLTLDPCKGASPKLSLPSIPDIPTSWNWMELLGEAFMFGLKQIISAVLVALMRKAAELLNTDLCKVAGNLTRGAADGGFEGMVEALICDDPRPGDTQDKINQNWWRS